VNLYLFNVLAALVYLAVGIRLSSLSRRTGGNPERLLGIHYLFAGVSYLLYEIPSLIDLPPTWFEFPGRILYALAIAPLLLFTRDVFRRSERWASGLIWGFLTCLSGGIIFSALAGDFEGYTVTNPWFWAEWVGYTVPYFWIATEAAIASGAAHKRVRLGIGEPLLANRFLLWALFGFLAGVAGVALVPLYIEFEVTGVWPAWGNYFVGGMEFAATAILWLAFFPPAAYRRWIERGAAMSVSESASA